MTAQAQALQAQILKAEFNFAMYPEQRESFLEKLIRLNEQLEAIVPEQEAREDLWFAMLAEADPC